MVMIVFCEDILKYVGKWDLLTSIVFFFLHYENQWGLSTAWSPIFFKILPLCSAEEINAYRFERNSRMRKKMTEFVFF